MADLIDILQGINPNLKAANPPIESDFSTVQPQMGDDEFYASIESEIDAAEIIDINFTDNDDILHIGCGSDPDVLRLGKTNVDPNTYRNVFIGYKGSIGVGGVFPYISDLPDLSNLSDETIEKFFGEKALGGKAQIDDETHIRIGEGAKACTPDLSECIERVFASSIVTVGGLVNYDVGLTDLDSIITHDQSSDIAISISDGAVTVHPPYFKRTIVIEPCGSSIARAANSENDGGVRYVGDQESCVEKLSELFPSNTSSAKLVRAS